MQGHDASYARKGGKGGRQRCWGGTNNLRLTADQFVFKNILSFNNLGSIVVLTKYICGGVKCANH